MQHRERASNRQSVPVRRAVFTGQHSERQAVARPPLSPTGGKAQPAEDTPHRESKHQAKRASTPRSFHRPAQRETSRDASSSLPDRWGSSSLPVQDKHSPPRPVGKARYIKIFNRTIYLSNVLLNS